VDGFVYSQKKSPQENQKILLQEIQKLGNEMGVSVLLQLDPHLLKAVEKPNPPIFDLLSKGAE